MALQGESLVGLEIKSTQLCPPPQECNPQQFLSLMLSTLSAACHSDHIRISTSHYSSDLLQVSRSQLGLCILLSLPLLSGGLPCDLSSLMGPTKAIDFHFVQIFLFGRKNGIDYFQALYTQS